MLSDGKLQLNPRGDNSGNNAAGAGFEFTHPSAPFLLFVFVVFHGDGFIYYLDYLNPRRSLRQCYTRGPEDQRSVHGCQKSWVDWD